MAKPNRQKEPHPRSAEPAAGERAPPVAGPSAGRPLYTMLGTGVVALAAVAVYSNSFSASFHCDDTKVIHANPAIRQLWPPWTPMLGTTRPIGTWTFAVNYALHGLDVRGYHAVNLAIHVVAGLFLFGVVRRTLGRGRWAKRFGQAAGWLALIVAVLWVVHPLQTQAVTYIVQRLESLMGMFYLAALYGFVRAQDARRPWLWYVASVLAAACAMGTKEVAVTFPLVVLWYDRALVAESWAELFAKRKGYYAALACLGLVCVVGVLTFQNKEEFHQAHDWLTYLVNQPAVIGQYLWLCFWPSGQCFDYAWRMRPFDEIAHWWAAVGGLVLWTAWGVWRCKPWSFLGVWFFAILSVTSLGAALADVVAEHRMYLPSAAVVTAVVIAVYVGFERWAAAHPAAAFRAGASLLILTLTAATALGSAAYLRNRVYRDDVSLWQDVVEKKERNPRGWGALGAALLEAGDDAQAEKCLRKAIELKPDYAEAHANLGVVLANNKQPDEAAQHLWLALLLDPWPARKQQNQSNFMLALVQSAEPERTLAACLAATPINPPVAARIYCDLALGLLQSGRLERAAACGRAALQLAPGNADADNIIAEVRKKQKDKPR